MRGPDAEILWEVASGLARETAEVSHRAGQTPPDLPPLLFFTDPGRTPCPWETVARLPPGSGVVFRHFGASDREAVALRLREVTREREVRLLIGLDAELAGRVEADGVHLPERALGEAAALRSLRPDWRLTGAAHSGDTLDRKLGLDAAVLSPVFGAGGASAIRPALGLEAFRALTRAATCPVYALGGVSAANARRLAGSGAWGIAGVSSIQAAFGPD